MKNTIQTEKQYSRHDKAWFYHLNQIEFDLFITIHFKKYQHYKNSDDADCRRRKLFREIFGDITSNLNIPCKSLAYFGITELDSQDKMHGHILLKKRKDLVALSNDELIDGIRAKINIKQFRVEKNANPRNVEVVNDSKDATNYILKIRTAKEREHSIKENFYYSKNFIQICKYIKEGKW
jgi:hypothetical protein